MALTEKLTAIADALRQKTGKSAKLTLDEMPAEVTAVYGAGGQDAYDGFWEAYQDGGRRDNYKNAFAGSGWTEAYIHPKYPVRPTSAAQMFQDSPITTLPHIEKFDFSHCTNMASSFINCKNLQTIPQIDMSSATNFQYAFGNCSNLETLLVVGEIKTSGLDLKASTLLTRESLLSILSALKDYQGSGKTYTVTLGATNLAKLTEAEKAIATDKGWTLQ